MKLWLDDIRSAPPGWTWVKTVEQAIDLLTVGEVSQASLDHDLGWCEPCAEAARVGSGVIVAPIINQCRHVKTGYDLACWFEEFPERCPAWIRIHSVNPAGGRRMFDVLVRIAKHCELRPVGS